ncbi:MAG TPA: AraC family transcriptional regulator [Opitutaceae bacterium]|nr:AraC family transcriptional regulator [Opitutaceae bacterium]
MDATLLSATDPFAVVHGAAEEVRRDGSYRWDNSTRGDPDQLVLQRTMSGAGFFRDATGEHLVPAQHAMLFTQREPTSYGYPAGATEPYRLRFLAFSPTGVRLLFDRIRSDFGSVVRLPEESEAAALFDELFEGVRGRRLRDRFHESEMIYRLLIALYREQVQEARERDPVEFGLHYLRSHFRSPINLKTVAARCGITREHFIREFRARHREAPGAMLRRLRLEHARTMLAATQLGLAEVARACGFASANTFARAYRARYGRSPGGRD